MNSPELFITGIFSISIDPSDNISKLVLDSLIEDDDSDICLDLNREFLFIMVKSYFCFA